MLVLDQGHSDWSFGLACCIQRTIISLQVFMSPLSTKLLTWYKTTSFWSCVQSLEFKLWSLSIDMSGSYRHDWRSAAFVRDQWHGALAINIAYMLAILSLWIWIVSDEWRSAFWFESDCLPAILVPIDPQIQWWIAVRFILKQPYLSFCHKVWVLLAQKHKELSPFQQEWWCNMLQIPAHQLLLHVNKYTKILWLCTMNIICAQFKYSAQMCRTSTQAQLCAWCADTCCLWWLLTETTWS